LSRPVFTVGLTGGVASGKSHVALLFEELGISLLDADQVSRIVVTPPSPVLEQIASRFGSDILLEDGSLDRRKLRGIVFADAQALRDLEALTHPAIRDYIANWRLARSGHYCIIANAILVESGMHSMVDRVLVVDASELVQLSRLLRRDNIDEATGRRMIAAQATRIQRLRVANDVIDNSVETRAVRPVVARLHALYCRLGGGH
jgi:dephospho-CoA kinase